MSGRRRKPGLISRIWTSPGQRKDHTIQEQALRIGELESDNLNLRASLQQEQRRRKSAETALKVLKEDAAKRDPRRGWSTSTTGNTTRPQAPRYATPSWVTTDPGTLRRVPEQPATSQAS